MDHFYDRFDLSWQPYKHKRFKIFFKNASLVFLSPIGLEQHDRTLILGWTFYLKTKNNDENWIWTAQIVQILGQMNMWDGFTGGYLFVERLSSSLCQTIRKATSLQHLSALSHSPSLHYRWMTGWKVPQGMTSHSNNGQDVCLICSWRALR